jgi:hypothetical protein
MSIDRNMSKKYNYIYRISPLAQKVKVHAITVHEGTEGGVNVQLYSFFNLGGRWGGWPTPRLGRFNSGEDPAPIV